MSKLVSVTRNTARSLRDTFLWFTWWNTWNQRFERVDPRKRLVIIIFVAFIGFAARMWAQTSPPNYDFDSWFIASSAVLAGEDPYATLRYNYAPPWLLILTALNWATSSTEGFRLGLAVLLALGDIAIAGLLIKRGYSLPAVLFLVSPIGIAISGQHQQFDNLAILLALLAMYMASRNQVGPLHSRDFVVVLLLGLSISLKHVFLFFPIWLLMTRTSVARRLLYFLGPLAIFAAMLLPAYLYSPAAVTTMILNYQGANNSPLVYFLTPDQLVPWLLANELGKVAFFVAIVVAGWLVRDIALFERALVYSIAVVLFSWAVVNQYLAIPMAGVAVFMNIGFLIWLLLASLYLLGDPTSLNVPILNLIQPHTLLEYNVVAQDLFPWLLFGYLLLMFRYSADKERPFVRLPLMDSKDIRSRN